MTDFYTELNLERNKRIDEINIDLSRLESTWKRREITNPEKATTMLALIIQARKVFATDASRRAYDTELENSKRTSETIDPSVERKDTLNKWIEKARSYYSNGQYDLAKAAIENAIPLSDNSNDDALFALAADIYRDNGDLTAAMNYINRAIVAVSDISAYYLSKGLIYDQQASLAAQQAGYGNSVDLRSEARKMFHLAESKAEQSGDLINRARACGALAFSYYFQNPKDKTTGENYANLAIKLGGDSWGNADKVLADVKKNREEADRKEREAQEKRAAEERRAREQREAEERAEQERKEADLRKRAERRRAAIITFLVIMAIVSVPVLSLRHNLVSLGAHINYKYDDKSGTLTISGKGEIRDYPTTLLLGRGLNYPPWDQDKVSRLEGLCRLIAPIGFTRDDVKILIISDGITRIGNDVFTFPNITEVRIPSSINSIGNEAFDFCSNLETVYLDNTVQSIGGKAFNECSNATIHFEGSIFEWADIELQGRPGGFDLRGCFKIICSDGILSNVEAENAFFRSDMGLLIEYNGTMEQWNDYYTNNQPEFDDRYVQITVICSDGEKQYLPKE